MSSGEACCKFSCSVFSPTAETFPKREDADTESLDPKEMGPTFRGKSMGHKVRCCDGIAKRPKKVIRVRELGVGVDIVTS